MSLLGLTSTSEAAVLVLVEDTIGGIQVSFEGTLDLGGQVAVAPNALSPKSVIFGNTSLVNFGFSGFSIASAGAASATGISVVADNDGIAGSTALGFNGAGLFFGAHNITGGDATAVTEVTFSAVTDTFLLEGVDVATLLVDNADLADGVVAWTSNANANDTITIQTVPEPSSFALIGLGTLSLLARRRR